jgi:hypothetical protein
MSPKKKSHQEDDVYDMKKGRDGVYYPIIVREEPPSQIVSRIFPVRVQPFYQFLEGFDRGLDVLERFFQVMKKGGGS